METVGTYREIEEEIKKQMEQGEREYVDGMITAIFYLGHEVYARYLRERYM